METSKMRQVNGALKPWKISNSVTCKQLASQKKERQNLSKINGKTSTHKSTNLSKSQPG